MNIYYDWWLPGNSYLNHQTYDFTNSYHLIPTPVPPSALLFLTGLLVLGLLGRSRLNKSRKK